MSSKGIQEALIDQKAEFLKMELDESRKRELSLKKLNESLMQAVQEFNPFQDLSLEELRKVNEQHTKDIESLKKRHSERIAVFEKQNHDLILSNKELKLDLKHQKVRYEGEKYDLQTKIKSLEAERLSLLNAPRPEINSNFQENIKLEYELKFYELKKDLEIQKEESKNEVVKAQQEAETMISQLKAAHNKEIETLKIQVKSLQFKTRHQNEKIEKFKKNDQSAVYKQKIDELMAQLDTYKATIETSSSLETSNSHDESPRAKSSKSKDQPPIVFKSQALTSRREFFLCEKCESFRNQVTAKEEIIQDLNKKIEIEKLQKERCKVELDKNLLEIKTLKQIQSMSEEKHLESELSLKNEIKFLIGKVLKAKSKLAVETELSDSFKREGMLSTLRSRSVNKTRSNARPPSPIQRSISPLNLSVIARSESPFGPGEIDLTRYA